MNNLTNGEAAAAGMVIGGTLTFAIIFYILTVIASWKILQKAGEKGWKALIPIYNTYLLYKIVGLKGWFWAIILIGIVYNIIASTQNLNLNSEEAIKNFNFGEHPVLLIATVVYIIFTIIAQIKYVINTAKAFGKGTLFMVALFFFPNICWLILGFGKAKYNKKAVNA